MKFTKDFLINGDNTTLTFTGFISDEHRTIVMIEGIGIPAFMAMDMHLGDFKFLGNVPRVLLHLEEELGNAIESFNN